MGPGVSSPGRYPGTRCGTGDYPAAGRSRAQNASSAIRSLPAVSDIRVEFVEGHTIAWKPAEPGQAPIGHFWRWEVESIDHKRSLVAHTYDWTGLLNEFSP
jgi:hypothetical protein